MITPRLFHLVPLLFHPVYAMDYTPPAHIPEFLRDIARENERATIDVRNPKEDALQKHKRHSREHSVIEINATLTEADGRETKLEVKKDGTLEKSGDTTNSDEAKAEAYTKRFVVLTNSATAVLTGLIGAGVTLAIRYADCKKD